MRACWLKWVGRDWSISADYIWLNYSGANTCEFPEDLRDARIGNEGCREMLLSSLADRTYLYEDHFHTLINNSDKHGRSSKHEAVEVERCFESMNGSEKMSSEAPSG